MSSSETNETAGFTVAELMVGAAMLAFVCLAAIPVYMSSRSKAQSTEATLNLARISSAATSFGGDPGDRGRPAVTFPATQAATPARSCCTYPDGKCPAIPEEWDSETWSRLHFAVTEPHLFRYEFVSTVTPTAADYRARAIGDLDCDGYDETYEAHGRVEGLFTPVTPAVIASGR